MASSRQSIPDAIEDVRVYLTWVPPSHAKGAADALQSLEEQLEAAERNAKSFRDEASMQQNRWLEEFDRREELQEQLESLRAALEDIAANGGSVGMHVPPPVREFARAVLASSPASEPESLRDVVRSTPGPISPDDLEEIAGRALKRLTDSNQESRPDGGA